MIDIFQEIIEIGAFYTLEYERIVIRFAFGTILRQGIDMSEDIQ